MTIFGGGDPIFDTQPRPISWMLQEIEARRMALPDFQRDFVWEPKRTRDLLVSVMCRFPAGALLMLKQANSPTPVFKPRSVDKAPVLNVSQTPPLLVLDGQQRLTSLYQAHRGVGEARYFVKMGDLVDNDVALHVEALNIDELVIFEVVKPKKPSPSDDPVWQYENWTFPVHELLVGDGFEAWMERAVAHHGGDTDTQLRRRLRLAQVRKALLQPLMSYNFPVIELDETTSLIAVCKIFETLNMGSVELSVFELITARVWAAGQNLRDLWDKAKQDNPILVDFKVDPYSVLQAVTLRSTGSAQRSKVLELRAENIEAHWDAVIVGFTKALKFLRDQCWVQVEKWLPYTMVVIPMAAAWDVVTALPNVKRGDALERLKQFFWCTVFTANYDQGGNSQAQADYGRLREWLPAGEGQPPEAVADFAFSESQLAAAKVNRRALYRGVMVLVMQSGALDFHSKQRLTGQQMAEGEVDAHHLFPQNWLKHNYAQTTSEPLSSELILNRALIDKASNNVIKDKAPSVYLQEMRDGEVGPARDQVLRSHVIDEKALQAFLADEYEAFIRRRATAVADAIEKVTNRPVTRDLATPAADASLF